MASYVQLVAGDLPIHWWRFADPGGLLIHDIGSAPYHLGAGLVYGSLGYSGPSEQAGAAWIPSAQFPQSVGFIPSLTSPFSWEGWFWQPGHPGFNASLLQWDGAGLPEAQSVILNNGTLQVSVNNSVCLSVATFPIQTWHHVAMTYDGVNVRGYGDGALFATTPLAGPVTINKQIGIGGVPGSAANVHQGALSDFAIYGYTLTAAQIAAHFAAGTLINQAPVYSQAGGLQGFGAGGSAQFVGVQQATLQGLTRNWSNVP